MTIKEAILQALDDLKNKVNSSEIYTYIMKQNYYIFSKSKTPKSTISALLGDFIRNNDSRVKRIKGKNGVFYYYLSKYEKDINFDNNSSQNDTTQIKTTKSKQPNQNNLIAKEIYINS